MPGERGSGGGTEVLERSSEKVERPPLWRVLLLNDDYTTMEFVIHVLQAYFQKSADEATDLMLRVHNEGSAVAGLYTRDVAETKVMQVTGAATAAGHPLRCRAEPES